MIDFMLTMWYNVFYNKTNIKDAKCYDFKGNGGDRDKFP